MRKIDDQAEPVRFGDQGPALVAESVEFGAARIGRGIGEVVVGRMDQAEHAQAQVIVGAEQARVARQWRRVLHADVDDALAGLLDACRIVRAQGDLEAVGIGGDHLADLDQPLQSEVARRPVAGRRALALRRVDHPKAAIESALDHARIVDLGEVRIEAVAVADAPVGAREQHRRVEMGIEHDRTVVQGRGALLEGFGWRSQRGSEQKSTEQQGDGG